jgi:HEPN domain-containing protein
MKELHYMSLTKNAHEAHRWRQAAHEDYLTALAKYYIPPRYPNGLPDLTPAQSYSAEDSKMALQRASYFLEQVRVLLPAR